MDDDLDRHLLELDPDQNYFENSINVNHVFTTYSSFDDFLNLNPVALTDNNFITIFSQNIRSLNRNLDSFLSMFPEESMPDVFIFSETWHDGNTPVNIPGYVGHHTVRQGRSGGVSVFVKSQLNSSTIEQLSYANETIEICTVKVSSLNRQIYVCGIYRPHSDSIENFGSSLENILNNNQLTNSTCIFAGDFNINLLSIGEGAERFLDMMRTHHYLQIITDVTHPGHGLSAPSLIDHVWLNQLCSYSCGVLKTGITDHFTIFMQIPFISPKSIKKN